MTSSISPIAERREAETRHPALRRTRLRRTSERETLSSRRVRRQTDCAGRLWAAKEACYKLARRETRPHELVFSPRRFQVAMLDAEGQGDSSASSSGTALRCVSVHRTETSVHAVATLASRWRRRRWRRSSWRLSRPLTWRCGISHGRASSSAATGPWRSESSLRQGHARSYPPTALAVMVRDRLTRADDSAAPS